MNRMNTLWLEWGAISTNQKESLSGVPHGQCDGAGGGTPVTKGRTEYSKKEKWPGWVWRATAASDCFLILGTHAFRLPQPPNDLTFTVMMGVLTLALFSAVAYALSA